MLHDIGGTAAARVYTAPEVAEYRLPQRGLEGCLCKVISNPTADKECWISTKRRGDRCVAALSPE